MESLFTCSPHSITPFTPSQLTLFPTTGYSIHLSHWAFSLWLVFLPEDVFIALLHILLPTGGAQGVLMVAARDPPPPRPVRRNGPAPFHSPLPQLQQ